MRSSYKKYLLLIIISLAILFVAGCEENSSTGTNGEQSGGTIFLSSNPQNANIFLLGTDTKKVTPDSIINLDPGTYNITLKLYNYLDTSFNVDVHNKLITSKSIDLESIFDGKLSYEITENLPFTNYIISFFAIYKADIFVTNCTILKPNNTSSTISINKKFDNGIIQKFYSMLFGNGQPIANPSGKWHFQISGYKYGYPTETFIRDYEINVVF
jgi:hypothetical protein